MIANIARTQGKEYAIPGILYEYYIYVYKYTLIQIESS